MESVAMLINKYNHDIGAAGALIIMIGVMAHIYQVLKKDYHSDTPTEKERLAGRIKMFLYLIGVNTTLVSHLKFGPTSFPPLNESILVILVMTIMGTLEALFLISFLAVVLNFVMEIIMFPVRLYAGDNGGGGSGAMGSGF